MSRTKATYARYHQHLQRKNFLAPTWDNLTPEQQEAWDYAIAPLQPIVTLPTKPLDCIGKPLPPTHTVPFFPFNPLNYEQPTRN